MFLVPSFISSSLSVLPLSSPKPQGLEHCRYVDFLMSNTVVNPLAGAPWGSIAGVRQGEAPGVWNCGVLSVPHLYSHT